MPGPAAEPAGEFALPPFATRIIKRALWGASALVAASFLILVVAHIDDRYDAGWVQGSRMALAQYANQGTIFPPLYDGATYGGTRFMPVPILLHAGTAQLTGEYLVSGKLTSFLMTLGLLAVIVLLLRKMGCPKELAIGLAAAVAATRPGFLAVTSIEGDALPLALQLGAIGLIAHRTDRRAVTGAAVLSVLGIVSKLSAVWAPPAIAAWLFVRHRHALWWFVGSFGIALVVALVALQAVSGGRALTNFNELSFAGVSGFGRIARAPLRAAGMASESGSAFLVLVPFAVLGAFVRSRRPWRLYAVALGCAVASLLVILLDEGTGVNHFLDVAALTALGAGATVSREGDGDAGRSAMASLLALALVWGMVTFTVLDLRPQVLGAWKALRSGPSARYAPTPLSGLIRPGDSVLSEDPTVPVRLGRFPPVILDAWALLRMEHRHPEWIADLADRIEREEFDWIVLSYSLQFRGWYSDVHLGDTIAEAIRGHYRPADAAETNGYFVYVPADRAP